MNILGIVIAVITFLVIGLFHPIVIKAEYYFGVKCWWVFALAGALFLTLSVFVEDIIVSSALGVIGCSSFWSILEIFEQRKRVEKGWFPKNPNRNDYKNLEDTFLEKNDKRKK
ncbi:MAG: DUF4491 family protein [Paludibacteraceae bacterium]|nr:DUF4491 family protein [Paludibacteraceae bacterium]